MSGKQTWSTGDSLTDDETQRGLRATPDSELQQLLHTMSRLDAHTIMLLPPGHRPILRVDEALLEDVLEHILEIRERMLELQVDELCGGRLARARGLVVYQPELGVVCHGEGGGGRRGAAKGVNGG